MSSAHLLQSKSPFCKGTYENLSLIKAIHARTCTWRSWRLEIDGRGQFCKRPWMWSAQLAALFPISIGAWQPGSTVLTVQYNYTLNCGILLYRLQALYKAFDSKKSQDGLGQQSHPWIWPYPSCCNSVYCIASKEHPHFHKNRRQSSLLERLMPILQDQML